MNPGGFSDRVSTILGIGAWIEYVQKPIDFFKSIDAVPKSMVWYNKIFLRGGYVRSSDSGML